MTNRQILTNRQVISEFDSNFNYHDNDIIPINLSFTGNEFLSKSLDFDLKILKILGHTILDTVYSNKEYSSIDWLNIKIKCYPYHTDFTFKRNMHCIKYIYLHGWTNFVIKMFNLNII